MFDVGPYVVHEQLLEDGRDGCVRCGEGSVARLADDSLLMMYSRFEGPRDEDRTTIVTRRSRDGGLSWSAAEVHARTPAGNDNIMSISLLPLRDGRLAAVYLIKAITNDCRGLFMTSSDGGRSWTPPRFMVEQPGYYTINNDRLIQLRGGRLLAPYAFYPGNPGEGACGCHYSDDGGDTWQTGPAITIDKNHILRPRHLDDRFPAGVGVYRDGDVHAQEPGVIELLDGRVMLWARTTGGYAYRAWSGDGGVTWSTFQAIPEFSMPCSPQSIARLPGSDRLVMLYNDREGEPFASPEFHRRRPLSVAVSDDDARTWQRHGLLEPLEIPSNCYYSICFHGRDVVFTYYQGAADIDPQGRPIVRNLAWLKLKVVRRDYFELS